MSDHRIAGRALTVAVGSCVFLTGSRAQSFFNRSRVRCGLILAALALILVAAGPSHAARVLVFGDSWANLTVTSCPSEGNPIPVGCQVLEQVLKSHGHRDTVALGALSQRLDTPEKLLEIADDLNENPDADLIHINWGAQTVDAGSVGTEAEPNAIAAGVAQVEIVIDHILAIRPDARILLSSKDFLHGNFAIALGTAPASVNAFLLRLAEAFEALADAKGPGLTYGNFFGLMQVTFGFDGIQHTPFDPPFPIPPGDPSLPDPNWPSPEAAFTAPDYVHVSTEGYVLLSEAAYDLFYLPILGDPASIQDEDQQKCINALSKDFAKVAKAKGKGVCDCIKKGAKGQLTDPSIEGCLLTDPNGKVGKATAKTVSDAAKNCSTTPDFGPNDPNTANDAAIQKELDLVHDIFGPDLDAVIATESNDKAQSQCQQAVMKAVKKCQDTKLKEFNSCKKNGLKEELFQIFPDLETECMDTDSGHGIPDSKGKIAKACDPTSGKIRSTIDKKCGSPVDASAAFPPCGTSDPATLAACLDQKIECRVCLALNAVDNLTRDCDEFDNGTLTASCGPDVVPPFGVIDSSPQLDAMLSGFVGNLGGWAIDNRGVVRVDVLLDGTKVVEAAYGMPRPDAADVHPGYPGSPNFGYRIALDTTLYADGEHTLEITATDAAGNSATMGGTPRQITIDQTDVTPPFGFLNVPSPDAVVGGGDVNVAGWAIDNIGVVQVDVLLDGMKVGEAVYGIPDQAPADDYPGYPGSPNFGYQYTLDTTLYADGEHTLEVEATDAAGNSASSVGSPRQITINNNP